MGKINYDRYSRVVNHMYNEKSNRNKSIVKEEGFVGDTLRYSSTSVAEYNPKTQRLIGRFSMITEYDENGKVKIRKFRPPLHKDQEKQLQEYYSKDEKRNVVRNFISKLKGVA